MYAGRMRSLTFQPARAAETLACAFAAPLFSLRQKIFGKTKESGSGTAARTGGTSAPYKSPACRTPPGRILISPVVLLFCFSSFLLFCLFCLFCFSSFLLFCLFFSSVFSSLLLFFLLPFLLFCFSVFPAPSRLSRRIPVLTRLPFLRFADPTPRQLFRSPPQRPGSGCRLR